MPWKKKIRFKPLHECNTPNENRWGVGSIWECWYCKRNWIIKEHTFPQVGKFWYPYKGG